MSAEAIIERTLVLMARAKHVCDLEDSYGKYNGPTREQCEFARLEYERVLKELDAMRAADALVEVVRHYEKRIADFEIGAARFHILKAAIREVMEKNENV